jgi:curved DNA-binding protein
MASPDSDHYEVLQVSPRADQETIHRVFRHLAKRYHPDNAHSGDDDRFRAILEAFRVLSEPELRAGYDASYEQQQEARWRIFDQQTAVDDVAADRRVRAAMLSALYTVRRNDPDRAGMGMLDLEHLLGCPEAHMKFHVWYLKENGWIKTLEDGRLAITASGVDRVLELGGPVVAGARLLEAGEENSPANGSKGSNGSSHPHR